MDGTDEAASQEQEGELSGLWGGGPIQGSRGIYVSALFCCILIFTGLYSKVHITGAKVNSM